MILSGNIGMGTVQITLQFTDVEEFWELIELVARCKKAAEGLKQQIDALIHRAIELHNHAIIVPRSGPQGRELSSLLDSGA